MRYSQAPQMPRIQVKDIYCQFAAQSPQHAKIVEAIIGGDGISPGGIFQISRLSRDVGIPSWVVKRIIERLRAALVTGDLCQ